MIDERMYGLGNAPSAIRELFAYGLKRKAEIGEDKVFDYSIGNPSVPAPQKVADTIEELAEKTGCKPETLKDTVKPSPTASPAVTASRRRRAACI